MYNNKPGVPQNNKGTSEKAVTLLQSAKCRDLDILQRVEGLGLGFRAQGMGVAQGSFAAYAGRVGASSYYGNMVSLFL